MSFWRLLWGGGFGGRTSQKGSAAVQCGAHAASRLTTTAVVSVTARSGRLSGNSFSAFSCGAHGKQLLPAVPAWGVGRPGPPPPGKDLYVSYSDAFHMGHFSILPYLFNQLFVSVQMYGYLLYTFDYNLVILHLFCCLHCPNTGYGHRLCFPWGFLF